MIWLAVFVLVSFVVWIGILLHPARPWDFWPVADDFSYMPKTAIWPNVTVLVPARNETDMLPKTLPSLLTQNYPGKFSVILIDDRSSDGTAATAQAIGTREGASRRLTTIVGSPLPTGWVGKMWALQQGLAHMKRQENEAPEYVLLTDADIWHQPGSLRNLVLESQNVGLSLNSRMARLRCESRAEHWLVPAFVFFFNMLYPMRQVNSVDRPVAAAAGGCALISLPVLQSLGGFTQLAQKVIDDVNLGRLVKGAGGKIRLSLSRREVISLRRYPSIRSVWNMVSRTAFSQLDYSWTKLTMTIALMFVIFMVPLLACAVGLGNIAETVMFARAEKVTLASGVFILGALTWCVMAVVYAPAICFFSLRKTRIWTLPFAAFLFGLMTVSSAIRFGRDSTTGWREE